MGEREREMYFIIIAFLEDSFCRGKRRSENGERERRKRKEKKNRRARVWSG